MFVPLLFHSPKKILISLCFYFIYKGCFVSSLFHVCSIIVSCKVFSTYNFLYISTLVAKSISVSNRTKRIDLGIFGYFLGTWVHISVQVLVRKYTFRYTFGYVSTDFSSIPISILSFDNKNAKFLVISPHRAVLYIIIKKVRWGKNVTTWGKNVTNFWTNLHVWGFFCTKKSR